MDNVMISKTKAGGTVITRHPRSLGSAVACRPGISPRALRSGFCPLYTEQGDPGCNRLMRKRLVLKHWHIFLTGINSSGLQHHAAQKSRRAAISMLSAHSENRTQSDAPWNSSW